MNNKESVFRYNWTETNVARFLLKYQLPVSYEGDFIEYIISYSASFLCDYKNMLLNGPIKSYSDKFYQKLSDVYKFIEEEFNIIITIIKSWEKSELLICEQLINKLLNNWNSDFVITDINRNYYDQTFYRVRKVDNEGALDKENPLELFHVPYSKRLNIPNDRYNIAGKPCLYLSTVLNLAWKECGMPELLYYSKYKINENLKDWRFICFYKPSEILKLLCSEIYNNEKIYSDIIVRYFKTYPIIFACSIVNKDKTVAYKPEYIISQLLCQWVDRNSDKIKGIIYFPCTSIFSHRNWIGYNVVIPVKDFDENGYSKQLKTVFDISNPIFKNNKLSIESKKKISDLCYEIKDYYCSQPMTELPECLNQMSKYVDYINELVNQTKDIQSSVLLFYVEMLSDNLQNFKKRFNLSKIIESCRNSDDYQERYEKEYKQFEIIFNEFIEIINIIEKYYSYIEKGFDKQQP